FLTSTNSPAPPRSTLFPYTTLFRSLLISQTGKGDQLRLRAVVLRRCKPSDLMKRADLLRYDSVHGPFAGMIVENIEDNSLTINGDRKSTRLNSSHVKISYAVFCLKK